MVPISTPPPSRHNPTAGGREKRELTGRLLQIATKLRMRRERKEEVRLTVEDEVEEEEKLKMSHQKIAVWIDCQARWLSP